MKMLSSRLICFALLSLMAACVGRQSEETKRDSRDSATLQSVQNIALAPTGCSQQGEIQVCPLQSGTITYENGGKKLTQVNLINSTTESYVVSRIDVTRSAGVSSWQEVGVFKCRQSDGFGCLLSPPGQVVHGIGEIHYLNSQPGSGSFMPEARFDGFTSMLIVEPGHYIMINSDWVVGGKFIVDARLRSDADVFSSDSWRLPRRDVNFPGGTLNYCSGGIDTLLDWGIGKNNPDGVNHYWVNDTKKQLRIGSATVAITSGLASSLSRLSHGACFSMFSPTGALAAKSCAINGDGLCWLNWEFPPDYVVALQGQNQCPAGNVWNMVAFLHVYDPAAQKQTTQSAIGPAPVPSSCKSTLAPNESLTANQQICSTDGRFVLTMQGDGNLVLTRVSDRAVLWHASKQGSSPRAVVQGDGNFVLYHGSTAAWQTATNGKTLRHLVVQNDGNLVLYSSAGLALWNTGTMQ